MSCFQSAGVADVCDHGQCATVQAAQPQAHGASAGVSGRPVQVTTQHRHLVAAQVRHLGTRHPSGALRLLRPVRPHGVC